jgi:DNA-directed RNA polymerase specialized sigma subunit
MPGNVIKKNKDRNKNKDSTPIENENEICAFYLPLIDTHIFHLKLKYSSNKNLDWDDVYSFLQLGLLKAVRSYQEGHNTTMKSWILTFLRGYTKNYFRDFGQYYSINDQIDDTNPRQATKLYYEINKIKEGEDYGM